MKEGVSKIPIYTWQEFHLQPDWNPGLLVKQTSS